MQAKSLISILSLLFLAISVVLGKSSTTNLRKVVSTDVETVDTFSIEAHDDKEKRILVSTMAFHEMQIVLK